MVLLWNISNMMRENFTKWFRFENPTKRWKRLKITKFELDHIFLKQFEHHERKLFKVVSLRNSHYTLTKMTRQWSLSNFLKHVEHDVKRLFKLGFISEFELNADQNRSKMSNFDLSHTFLKQLKHDVEKVSKVVSLRYSN